MPNSPAPQDLPVLVLYNVDPGWSARERQEVDDLTGQLATALAAAGHDTESVRVDGPDLQAALAAHAPDGRIVFNWCEGLPGVPRSEPLVAQALAARGYTYTGAPAAALALAQDKAAVKSLLAAHGMPTPAWRLFERPTAGTWDRYPAIVKVACEHASEGLTRESVVMDAAELRVQVERVLDVYRQPAMVEDFVDGREFHVSLWGNGRIDLLPVAEMDFSAFDDPHDRLCSYEAKFTPGSRHYEGIRTVLPAVLTADEQAALADVCRRAYRAVGCRDYGRIDVRLRGGVWYVLDVNPNADISADASLACAAEHAGYSYAQAGSRIVQLAAHRRPG